MEVHLTASLMEMQWHNTMANYCTDDPQLCDKMVKFVYENSAYVGVDKNTSEPRWYQVSKDDLWFYYCCCCYCF